MDTLPGLEEAGLLIGAQERATRDFISSYYADIEPDSWDKIYSNTLVQIAKAIDSYIDLRKNPSTLFDSYNQTLERINALHPDDTQGLDDDVAELMVEAHK